MTRPAPPPLPLGFATAEGVMLAPFTTLELGGPARHLVEIRSEAEAAAVVAWAREQALPLFVLGGGSNVVVADAGFDGVVARMAVRGVSYETDAGGRVLVRAAAGEPWDRLVEDVVARDLGGIECLAGIPGSVGATPIQNVGAYGQEVAQTILSVRVLDRGSGDVHELALADCGFGYRDSMFKRRPDAYMVLAVTFALTPSPGDVGPPRHGELEAELRARVGGRSATLAELSATVRAVRRRKSMVIDATDPNRRSVGSFFTNPVLSAGAAAEVVARAIACGAAREARDVPQFGTNSDNDQVKLSAGWLIERAGFKKGLRRGAVGLSSNHALALVHHGGGSTAALLSLAHEIQDAVRARFGVQLSPEPVLVGTTWPGTP